jgi:hypothetical protein
MKPFNRANFDRFMDRIKNMNIQTLEDTYDQPGGNIVNIRHDVDDDIMASFQMALAESELGIRSTYYILDSAPYWPREVWKYVELIARFGHEIGWHNNAITRHLKTGTDISQCISEPLNVLRQYAPVIGSASHGDPLCHVKDFLNYNVFIGMNRNPKFPYIPPDQFDMEYFGLKYEVYHTGNTHYLSDAGGLWNHEPLSYIEQFEREGDKLQINIHPQWWQL